MKRSPKLQPFSRDHHHALVLARRASQGALGPFDARRAFDEALAPHFALEEEELLPTLREAGRGDLADRARREHDAIRSAIASDDMAAFGRLLAEHVRFEEREMFPVYEALAEPA